MRGSIQVSNKNTALKNSFDETNRFPNFSFINLGNFTGAQTSLLAMNTPDREPFAFQSN